MKQHYYLLFFISSLLPLVSQAQLNAEAISENVTHLAYEGTSVKATLIRNGSDAILVDAMYDSLAIEIKKYIDGEGLTLTHLINTHYHGDHTDGNQSFKSVNIIAHTNTRDLIESKAPYGPPESFSEEDKPNLLFNEKMTLYLNDLQVQLIHFGNGHTTGDVIVYVPKINVVIVGDLILDAKSTLPFYPNPEHGVAVLNQIVSIIDDNTQVITGHGSIGSKQDIVDLVTIINQTIEYSKSGKDPEKFPEEWKAWDSPFITMAAWLKRLDKIYE